MAEPLLVDGATVGLDVLGVGLLGRGELGQGGIRRRVADDPQGLRLVAETEQLVEASCKLFVLLSEQKHRVVWRA